MKLTETAQAQDETHQETAAASDQQARREAVPAPDKIAPAPAEPRPSDKPAAEKPKGGRPIRKIIAMILLPLIALGAGWYGYNWWMVGRYLVSTDDAYIKADNATLAAKVSGYVASVEVSDNAHVAANDVIARIDDGDYRLAVQSTRDNVASQQATIERIRRQVTAQEAALDQANAQFASAQAGAQRAAAELQRQQDLAKRDFASRQTLEQAEAANAQAVASVDSAKAAIEAAKAQIEVVKAQEREAEGVLKQLQTAQAKAERDLSFTVIRAPFNGVVGNRAMQPGDYVQPGQRLASLVPLDAVYIDANFKETQLGDLKPGQPVDIEVDAVPGHVFHGHVVSFAPASGSVFSLLPPDNATGNFTKVVQRIPVRVRVDRQAGEQDLLRPGMSVVVSVNTKGDAAATSSAGQAQAAPAEGK
jgi:membrane fusion protein (multidrug efflux system)